MAKATFSGGEELSDQQITLSRQCIFSTNEPFSLIITSRLPYAWSRCLSCIVRRPQASTDYYETQRRYNYVTPKSYLELIGFYKFLLDQKRTEVQRQIDRLDVGLSTLRKTAADVAELQVDLTHTMVKVQQDMTEYPPVNCHVFVIVDGSVRGHAVCGFSVFSGSDACRHDPLTISGFSINWSQFAR